MERLQAGAFRRGITIVEALITVALLSIFVIALAEIMRGGWLQEQQITEFSGLQQEARRAIMLLQRDFRGMEKLEILQRGESGRLETLVMVVPTGESPVQEVRYAFNPSARILTRNGDAILSESVEDVQVWPFDHQKEPQEVHSGETFDDVSFFKVRLTLARRADEAGQPGVGHRIFDFLVYPRLPNSIRKVRESRLNMTNSRFRPQQLDE